MKKTKAVYLNHGMKEPMFGVKTADLRKLAKKIKKDTKLAMELYAVAPVTAKCEFAEELADTWIDSENDIVCAGGYGTYSEMLAKYVPEILEEALSVACDIGKVPVYMGKKKCTVPVAEVEIKKLANK